VTGPAPRPSPASTVLPNGSLAGTAVVTPGMCGPNSLLAGRLGDWTWDAVSAACGVNAYTARTAAGEPTYLSFYYFRVRAGADLDPSSIAFGDELQVVSRVFGISSESVLTLHRLRRDTGRPPEPIEPEEFYAYADPGCIYVENFNRWVSRSRPDSNRALVSASPAGLRHQHLPRLPDRFSPRPAYTLARTTGSFAPPDGAGPGRAVELDYPVEASRDLNGVGLLYFASYFSVVDWAVLRLWRRLGRDHRDFLARTVLDHQLCYVGNADGDAVLRIAATTRPAPGHPGEELVDTVVRLRDTGALLAVSTQRIRPRPVRGTEAP
jgi:probable biosynthetic protein (TIGR04098 family)